MRIAYLKGGGSYTHIHIAARSQHEFIRSERVVAVNLGEIKPHLPACFYNLSKPYCINLRFLDRIGTHDLQLGPYELEMPNGKESNWRNL